MLKDSTIDYRETGRTEAFSDGVIAFAITLLVINLRDPVVTGQGNMSLFQGLLTQWPAFFAFITSFATILIMWVNHHNMFTYIKRVNTTLLFLNGLLLFFIVLTAFTTLLIANHVTLIQTSDGRTAAAIYSVNAVCLGATWSGTRYYCSKTGLGPEPSTVLQYWVGPIPYLIALALAFISGFLTIVAVLVTAGFWAVVAKGFWMGDTR
jgi:uncharacterized membrane protein